MSAGMLMIIALAGCSAAPESSPSPSISVPAEPAPSPTPSSVTAPVPPFAGDCENVLPAAEASSIVGADPAVSIATAETAWRYPIETAGGLFCTWDGADEYLQIVALPAAEVPPDLSAMYASPECVLQYDWSECSLSRERDGVWTLAVLVYDGLDVPPAPVEWLEAILDIATDRVSSFPSPERVTPSDRTWSLPDCAALAAYLDVAKFLGPSEVYEGLMTEGPGPLDKRIAASIGTMRECGWTTLEAPVVQLAAVVEPDAGWSFGAWQSRHESTGPLELAGATSAVRVREGEFDEELLVTDSVNVLRVTVAPSRDDQDIAARMLTFLTSTG